MQPYGLKAAALCAWAAALCAQAAISCGRGYGLTQGCTAYVYSGVLDGATHVYMANLCFPEALNHAMTTALAAVSPLAAVARYSPRGPPQPMRARGCRCMHRRLQPCVSEFAPLTH